jgi:dUTP pyrophosphatase
MAPTILMPLQRLKVPTGISITPPKGHYGRIAPRSGLAVNYGIDVLAGVIDEDYTGEIGVILYNTGDKPLVIENGMKIAQIIFEQYSHIPRLQVVENLESTTRGDRGFGSTGL